jgi:hypothetical protein
VVKHLPNITYKLPAYLILTRKHRHTAYTQVLSHKTCLSSTQAGARMQNDYFNPRLCTRGFFLLHLNTTHSSSIAFIYFRTAALGSRTWYYEQTRWMDDQTQHLPLRIRLLPLNSTKRVQGEKNTEEDSLKLRRC